MERSNDALAKRENINNEKFTYLKNNVYQKLKNKSSTLAILAKRPGSVPSNLSLQSREKRAEKRKKTKEEIFRKRFRFQIMKPNSYL